MDLLDLKPGQALIGDHTSCGLSKQQYRTVKQRLKRWGLAEFKSTRHGTVATLLTKSIYDVNETRDHTQITPYQHPGNTLVTLSQHPGNTLTTTNKNEKNEKNEKKYPLHSDEWRLSQLLFDLIVERKPDLRPPDLERWAEQVNRMIRLDTRTPARIEAVIRWCQKDPFWRNNILCTSALRKHFDRLELQMGGATPKESTGEMVARLQREGTL